MTFFKLTRFSWEKCKERQFQTCSPKKSRSQGEGEWWVSSMPEVTMKNRQVENDSASSIIFRKPNSRFIICSQNILPCARFHVHIHIAFNFTHFYPLPTPPLIAYRVGAMIPFELQHTSILGRSHNEIFHVRKGRGVLSSLSLISLYLTVW